MKRDIILFFTFCIVECYCLTGIIEEVLDIVKNLQDPDTYRNVSQLITSKGYPLEEHTVQTPDGYILSIQRIPHGRKNKRTQRKNATVFLQHGTFCTSDIWLLNTAEESLGYILADEGYDVWLGNLRGNTYSRKNVKYTPDQKQFWDFGLDETALIDLPAMIDYVLKATGQEKIHYVGHSQGTFIAFALLSARPEYNDKMRLFVALAPVAYVVHMRGPNKFLADHIKEFELLTDLFNINEFLPNNEAAHTFKSLSCFISPHACEKLWFQMNYPNPKEMNSTRWPVIWGHYPAGTSPKTFIHYGQMSHSKKIRKFDYGKCNIGVYKQEKPPEYDLSKITTPVALFASSKDQVADTQDVQTLRRQLKSEVFYYHIPDPDFNHFDFVLALHANKLVYSKLLPLLMRY